MPEEARLLVKKGIACIVDDASAHNDGMRKLVEEDRKRFLGELKSQGLRATKLQASRKEQQREEALKKLEEKKAAQAQRQQQSTGPDENSLATPDTPELECSGRDERPDSSFSSSRASMATRETVMGITPATSHPPLALKPFTEQLMSLPPATPSYPLFAHLHSLGYFLSPGLRFGCQYLAYPGDPLRFHSHFLVVSAEWDEEIDLMNVIVGGRLGTGVKKGFLIGGSQEKAGVSEINRNDNVKTFSIEWAGM